MMQMWRIPPSTRMNLLCVRRLALGAVGPAGITRVAGASVGWGAVAVGDGVSAAAEFVCG